MARETGKLQTKYARYGPMDRYDPPPGAGMCVSIFAIVNKKGSKNILIGIPKDHEKWRGDWLYSKVRRARPEIFEEWRLPSCYLREGENPEAALKRVMHGQLGIRTFKIKGVKVLSYYSPSEWYPGQNHWDLALVYYLDSKTEPLKKVSRKWWSELAFLKKGKELRAKDYGWNRELMADLDLL